MPQKADANQSVSGLPGGNIKNELRPLFREWAQLPAWLDHVRLEWEKVTPEAAKRLKVAFPHRLFALWFGESGKILLEKAIAKLWPEAIIVYEFPVSDAGPVPAREHAPAGENLFDSFIQGNKNQITVKLLKSAAHGPGNYPVLLRGPAGCGKSHLLRACFQVLRTKNAEACLLSCADLGDYLAPEAGGRHFLQSRSALLLDDLQLLESRPDMQQELAKLLDNFLPRPFFCASPERKPKLAPELATRLEAGMLLKLPEADLDMRLRYVQTLLEQRGLNLPGEQQLLLARRCLNMRQIQGVTGHLATLKDYHGRVPDAGELDALLRQTGSGRSLNAEQILAVVAAHYGFQIKDLRGARRDARLVLARQMAMFLCRKLLRETYPDIGRFFGGKDHSTIIYSVKKIELSQVRNKDMHNEATLLTQKCLQLLE